MVTGSPPLLGAQSLFSFGIKESPFGTSLAINPSSDFAVHGLDSGLLELLVLGSSFLGPPGAYRRVFSPWGLVGVPGVELPPGLDPGFLVLSAASWS